MEENKAVRWGVIDRSGRFYPARDKEQAAKWAAYSYGDDDYSQSLNGVLATEGMDFKPLEHTRHRLWFRPVGMVNHLGVLTTAPERLLRLDPTPAYFRHKEGTYAEISAEANRLNLVQTRSNYHDYLYFPEPLVDDDDFAENIDLEELWNLPAYEKDLEAAA